MCPKDGEAPDFYKRYVEEIQRRVVDNAKAEFDCIHFNWSAWREHEATKKPRTVISNQLSDKINQLDDYIRSTSMFDVESTRLAVMHKALPKTLLQEVGIKEVLERVPEAYQRAIFSNFIASHYNHSWRCTFINMVLKPTKLDFSNLWRNCWNVYSYNKIYGHT